MELEEMVILLDYGVVLMEFLVEKNSALKIF
jgi:hypothetical protein